jgi:hypothetical protein
VFVFEISQEIRISGANLKRGAASGPRDYQGILRVDQGRLLVEQGRRRAYQREFLVIGCKRPQWARGLLYHPI